MPTLFNSLKTLKEHKHTEETVSLIISNFSSFSSGKIFYDNLPLTDTNFDSDSATTDDDNGDGDKEYNSNNNEGEEEADDDTNKEDKAIDNTMPPKLQLLHLQKKAPC